MKFIARFIGAFVLIYGLLLAPWPGTHELYARYFCSFARLLLSPESGNRILRFDTVPTGERNRTLDLRIMIANRTQRDANGSVPAVMLDIDSRGIGFIPTALLCSLVLATPLPWKRRGLALVVGLVAVHALIFAGLQASIWDLSNDSTGLDLIQFSPFLKTIVSGIDETLVTQMGASFVVPLLIWVLVSFGRAEIELLREKMRP